MNCFYKKCKAEAKEKKIKTFGKNLDSKQTLKSRAKCKYIEQVAPFLRIQYLPMQDGVLAIKTADIFFPLHFSTEKSY